MKVNNPYIPKFPIKVVDFNELIKITNFLNELGYKWKHETINENWRTDFDPKKYPLELRNNFNDKKKITIHTSYYGSKKPQ